MGETTDNFDLKALSARIDRDLAETGKLLAETRKFVVEQAKLQAEQDKLGAEQAKLQRDRGLAPWLAISGLIGGLLAIATLLARIGRFG
jgi:hypothetical protein